MKNRWQDAVLLSVMSVAVPASLSGTQLAAQVISNSCPTCQLPSAQCHCTAQQPVVETQMVPRQVTTMRNEVVTQYRQEAYTRSVPVTTYRQVVVDEGHYQRVWVPKPVTKQVPQTVYQQQTAYRTVPCQTTRQVPHIVTQMVPQQVVRYQPYSFQTAAPAPSCTTGTCGTGTCSSGACSTCNTCGTVMPQTLSLGHVPVMVPSCTAPSAAVTGPLSMLPSNGTSDSRSAETSFNQPESADPHGKPVPDPKFLESPGAVRNSWTTVGSRSRTGEIAESPISPAEPQIANESSSRIRFKPARTVYRSWEAQTQMASEPQERQ